ncbi:MAG: DNA repair protein RecO [Bacilli bacterium]|nr:DNA repair protein RecO [Bacilli bacterium]
MAWNSGEKIKKRGIVLRNVPTKGNDAMITALGDGGVFSFYARGVRKLPSKNGSGCTELCLGSFILTESQNGPTSLVEASPEALLYSDKSLESSICASLLAEAALKLFSEPGEEPSVDLFMWLEASLRAIKDSDNPLAYAFIGFCKLLVYAGIGLDVGECVLCGKKTDIVGVSYADGGFVCRDCAAELGIEKSPVVQLKMLRFAFRCAISDLPKAQFAPSDSIALLIALADYLSEQTGINLSGMKLLRTI